VVENFGKLAMPGHGSGVGRCRHKLPVALRALRRRFGLIKITCGVTPSFMRYRFNDDGGRGGAYASAGRPRIF
jgi:hypothetical protein